MTETIMKGRLDGKQRNKLKSLFDMMYSPRELSEEIGVHVDQIYQVYVPLGCPEERDKGGHILINGKAFANWYINIYQKIKLKEDEIFCKSCKKGVKIIQPETKRRVNLIYMLSVCPNCGRKLTKIITNKRERK